MRVLVESKNSMVIERKGRVMLLILPVLLVLHVLIVSGPIRGMFAYGHSVAAIAIILLNLLLYGLLVWLFKNSLSDRLTLTFQGQQSLITLEHAFPFSWKYQEKIRFSDFECIQISPPDQKGFCQLRMSDGKKKMLFPLRSEEDFAIAKKLETVTRKKIEMVMH